MPRLRFLHPSTGLGLESEEFIPKYGPFIGRFHYLRLFAWFLLALISASLKLSGGRQQRVAIARALASDAPVILADEPTGNLDADTADEITAVLKESAHAFGKCVVVVTHDREVAKQADIVLEIKRGHLKGREM